MARLAGKLLSDSTGGMMLRVAVLLAVLLLSPLAMAAERVISLGGQGCYLLLDEPSSSLDPAHQHGLLRTARRAATKTRAGVLVVLHDVNLAAQYCDRLALMVEGGITACGAPSQVLQPELLQQVYGTAVHVQNHPVHADTPQVVFL